MANARSRFDTIAGYLQRAHEAHADQLYGKPCLTFNGNAFAAYATAHDAMAFRLHGRTLTQAQALPGARSWDPLRGQGSTPGWVLIPASQVMRWDRLALDALRCAREAAERRVSYALPKPPPPVEAPPPSTPTSLAQRFAAAVAAGFRSLSAGRAE